MRAEKTSVRTPLAPGTVGHIFVRGVSISARVAHRDRGGGRVHGNRDNYRLVHGHTARSRRSQGGARGSAGRRGNKNRCGSGPERDQIPPFRSLTDSVAVPLPVAPAVAFVAHAAPTDALAVLDTYSQLAYSDASVPGDVVVQTDQVGVEEARRRGHPEHDHCRIGRSGSDAGRGHCR